MTGITIEPPIPIKQQYFIIIIFNINWALETRALLLRSYKNTMHNIPFPYECLGTRIKIIIASITRNYNSFDTFCLLLLHFNIIYSPFLHKSKTQNKNKQIILYYMKLKHLNTIDALFVHQLIQNKTMRWYYLMLG